MGSFANSLFKIMLGWLQTVVSSVWSAFTSENGSSFFNWIGRNWILTVAVLCVAGLVTDLCVYLFRWKPYKVWKSFFSRRRETEGEQPGEHTVPERHEEPRQYRSIRREPSPAYRHEDRQASGPQLAPDLSRWETEEEPAQEAYADEEPPTVTNAGYVVPADSPYRRPVPEDPPEVIPELYQRERMYEPRGNETEEPRPIAPRKRRRLNVSELFTDPEEELQQFDAPQHVIDSRKAYRNPVYPRGWEKNEDDGE